MANCSVEGRGSLFDWDNVGADWILGNETDWEEFDFSRLCERDTFKDKFIMSEPVSYAYFKPLCDKMDGRLPTPMNTTELAMLHDEVSRDSIQLNFNRMFYIVFNRIHYSQ